MVDPAASVASEGLNLDTVILPLMVVALPAGIGKFPVEARVVPLAGEGIVVSESVAVDDSESVAVSESEEEEEDSSD